MQEGRKINAQMHRIWGSACIAFWIQDNIQQLAKKPTLFWIALTAIDVSVGDHYESGYKEDSKHSSCSLTDIIHLVYNKKKLA